MGNLRIWVRHRPTSKEYGIDYDVNKHDFHCVFAKQNGPLNDSPDQRESYNALVRLNLFSTRHLPEEKLRQYATIP